VSAGLIVLGEKEVQLKLGRAAKVASGPMLERALVAGALLPTNRAKELCAKKTGNLARSIHIGDHQSLTGGLRGSTGTSGGTSGTNIGGSSRGRGYAVVLVGTNVEYGPDVEYGTSAHEIRPENAKALFWPGAAHPFAKVNHPGTPAQPFMRPAFDGAGSIIAEEMSRVIQLQIEAAL
jgi:hypothetical protein